MTDVILRVLYCEPCGLEKQAYVIAKGLKAHLALDQYAATIEFEELNDEKDRGRLEVWVVKKTGSSLVYTKKDGIFKTWEDFGKVAKKVIQIATEFGTDSATESATIVSAAASVTTTSVTIANNLPTTIVSDTLSESAPKE